MSEEEEEDEETEEVNLRETVKADLESIRDIDLGILDAYHALPKEFRAALPFESYYNFYRSRIEANTLVNGESSQDSEQEPIPEEELCKMCKKERHSFNDLEFCLNCREKLSEEAQKRMDELQVIIAADSEFLKLKNAEQRRAYVEINYKKEKEQNKFIALKAVSERAYAYSKVTGGAKQTSLG